MSEKGDFKSGFVGILGAPNVGKSTLLNQMLGEKLSITSKKPQTTRNRILGVIHRPAAQIIFFDTPGVHPAKTPLNVRIVETAVSVLGDVDLVLAVADAASPDVDSEALLVKALKKQKQPVVLALNKIDLIDRSRLLPAIDRWATMYTFTEVVPVSAKTGLRVDTLIATMENLLPAGPPFFAPDAITDMSERFVAAEMIREKVFRLTGQELPYSTAVTVESFKENPDKKRITIHATIHVERASQKGMIVGKGGQKLKRIGTDARKAIERMVGSHVYLRLFVRVQKNWSKDTKALRKLGY